MLISFRVYSTQDLLGVSPYVESLSLRPTSASEELSLNSWYKPVNHFLENGSTAKGLGLLKN